MLSRRNLLGLSALVLVTACGGGGGGPRPRRFLRYDGPPITQVQVFKGKRRMYLFSGDKLVKSYKIALGGNPVGPKRFEGDGRTPEGVYVIDRLNPSSAYHLSLGISYPNAEDRAHAAAQGRRPGGDIFIHGRAGKNRGRGRDWTAGCIAVKDHEIEEIFSMVRVGTPIFLFP
ncbi:L,D-transpeptidase family protein [Phaeovulum vinaykumarii]|uniref:L,D-transpeptidase catalytic domain n=1 Tax=Phaeovulum vinaykumarii TaxID=407234 RepID=A0A1N7KZU2_9RHOB|nr:L,D-transpeptidase family protein [Phaeovulum vinaykumarii]SIS67095.1 L,D-transpeptidase catalytic domain [Phaeovulum vinaykumarii]SOC00845.1 L,D-transpeptidase-like protein [Phaeovulum vinaykumarii]